MKVLALSVLSTFVFCHADQTSCPNGDQSCVPDSDEVSMLALAKKLVVAKVHDDAKTEPMNKRVIASELLRAKPDLLEQVGHKISEDNVTKVIDELASLMKPPGAEEQDMSVHEQEGDAEAVGEEHPSSSLVTIISNKTMDGQGTRACPLHKANTYCKNHFKWGGRTTNDGCQLVTTSTLF